MHLQVQRGKKIVKWADYTWVGQDSPQALVVRRLDVLLVVGRLAEQLRAVLLRTALLLPLPQVLPEHFLRLDLEITERAGDCG